VQRLEKREKKVFELVHQMDDDKLWLLYITLNNYEFCHLIFLCQHLMCNMMISCQHFFHVLLPRFTLVKTKACLEKKNISRKLKI